MDEDNIHSFNFIQPRHTQDLGDDVDPENERAWTSAWHQGSIVFGSQIVALKPTAETHAAGTENPPLGTAAVDRYEGFDPYTNPPLVNWPALNSSNWLINDGDFLQVGFQDSVFDFEFDFGPQVQQTVEPLVGNSVRDGFFFVLDPTESLEDDEDVFQFDTGVVIEFFDTVTNPVIGAFTPA